jgi:transcriptional regulator with XRE-family HTH domain
MEKSPEQKSNISREEFSNLVNSVISELDISENDFCDRFGVSIPTVQRYRNEETMPMPAMANKMAVEMRRLIEEHQAKTVSDLGSAALKGHKTDQL